MTHAIFEMNIHNIQKRHGKVIQSTRSSPTSISDLRIEALTSEKGQQPAQTRQSDEEVPALIC